MKYCGTTDDKSTEKWRYDAVKYVLSQNIQFLFLLER